MEKRKSGQSDLEVSALAFGAWAIGGWQWGGGLSSCFSKIFQDI
jgi:aryl-alcohol dehydrogenase-like predicted oxidoreductase